MPMFYLIEDTLTEADYEECLERDYPYVAIVSREEFENKKELFDMGIDMELFPENAHATYAKVNYDSLTGTFFLPERASISEKNHGFAFALDEHGIAFINDQDGVATRICERIRMKKKWRMPSLERFLYDFLEEIVIDDLSLLEKYEKELDEMEDHILDGDEKEVMERLLDIRRDILDLRTHYEQLIDMGQEFEENENGFFRSKNLRYFDMFTARVQRLQDIVNSLRDHTMQVRDLYHSQLEVKQNRIMTYLTIVSTIFMPLTLIVGWYGMNFKYMPELESPYAYPFIIVLCLMIIIGSIIFIKKKKLL